MILSNLPPASGGTSFLNSPLLGDYDSIEYMKPRVILNFLADCHGVSIDLKSCLVSNVVQLLFPYGKWDDQCQLKHYEITTAIYQSRDRCPFADLDEAKALRALLSNQQCAAELCKDDSFYAIESAWMKDCAEVDLPVPPQPDYYNNTGNMYYYTGNMTDDEDTTLSCMIHFAMTTPAPRFGLPERGKESKERCYPPGYGDMDYFCSHDLGNRALEECTTKTIANAMLVSSFCSIMSDLSSLKGRQCLAPLCSFREATPNNDGNGGGTTDAPTFPWRTDAPTFPPTEKPTLSPSTEPPTRKPQTTIHPSRAPSAAPSAAPSVVPSVAPSDYPSSSPFTTSPVQSEVPDILEATFFTVITFHNASTSSISSQEEEHLQRALEDSVSSILSSLDGNVTVEVVSIEELSNGMVDVEFQVDVRRDCHEEDCHHPSLSDAMLLKFKGALQRALASGDLTSAIQEQGVPNIAPELESIALVPGQSPFVRFSVQVHKGNKAVIGRAVSGSCACWRASTAVVAAVLLSMFWGL